MRGKTLASALAFLLLASAEVRAANITYSFFADCTWD